MGRQLRKEGRPWRDLFFPALMSVAFFCCSALGEEGASAPVAARFRVHPMKKIAAEKGVEYLEEVGITVTTSKLKGTNTLLVTSDNQLELAKASAVLNLVDSDYKYTVAPIATASEANDLPAADQLQKLLPDAAVGTFLSPPRGERPVRAIMDVHGDMVLVVAPSSHLERIFAAVNQYRTRTKAPAPAIGPTAEVVIGPNDVVVKGGAAPEVTGKESYQDELFGDLMDSLDAERLKQRPARRQAAAPESGKPLMRAAEQAAEAAAETDEELVEQLRRLMQQKGKAEREIVLGPEEEGEVIEINGKEVELPAVEREAAQRRSYEPTFDFDPEQEIGLQLPEAFEIMLLLDLAGKYLSLDYIYDAQELKGVTVNMKLNGELSGSLKLGQLYPLLETTLKMKGFVMTRYGSVVWIRKKEVALEGNLPIIDGGEQIEAGDVIATRVFKLEYIDTTNAKNLVENMQLSEKIIEVPEQGALFVIGYTSQMGRVERLLQIVDKPGKPKKFRFRQLQYTMADAIAPKIESLAEQLGTVSITIAQATPTVSVAPPRGAVRRAPPRPTGGQQAAAAAAAAPSAPTVYLDADARTNRILMIGLDEQLDIVDELVDALDVEQQDLRTLRLYDMQYVEAEDVRLKLEELGIVSALRQTSRQMPSRLRGAQQAAAQRVAQQGQPGAIPQTTPPGQTVEEILSEEPQVVIIESTNSLLVNATPAQQSQIAVIIGYVDSETLEAAKPYRIYKLENQNPVDMAATLTKLIQESVKDETAKIEQVVRKTEEEIVIVPDEATFSLIVYASKKNQEWLENMIKTLDRRRPQVLIDVTLVSVERADEFEMDLEIASNFGGAADNTVLPQISTPFTREHVSEVFSSPIITDPDQRSQAFYGDKNIQFLLTAMQRKSYGRVLAKPKILVNDGQAGTIQTLETTNVPITSTIVPDQGTAQTATDFREYEAGLTLTITPNISEGDLLLLQVELIRSSFQRGTDPTIPPDKREANMNTVVTVPNNRTIILGGVISLDQTKGGNKIPILGDLPLIGGLFRSISNLDNESKLYIFVKANILRPLDGVPGLPELETISAENRSAFEEFEGQFQGYESWPGIKSKPMPPVNVLDTK